MKIPFLKKQNNEEASEEKLGFARIVAEMQAQIDALRKE